MIDAARILELAARGEGTALDFKVQDYDWTRPASNAEFAKDLMAFANSLRPNSASACILVGVDNQGNIVGVAPSTLLDDAQLHQKVQNLLNRTPDFSFTQVVVGGLTVGVYEIRGGGRPCFPLRDAAPSLRRHTPLYRNGSTTDVASPAMVLEWAREDDPDAHRLRSLELRRLEAETVVHARLRSTSVSTAGDALAINFELENRGRASFWVESCRWQVEWNEKFNALLGAHNVSLPPGYQSPAGEIQVDRDLVQPSQIVKFTFRWSRQESLEHLRQNDLSVPGFSPDWAHYHFRVPCRGELGGEADASFSVRH